MELNWLAGLLIGLLGVWALLVMFLRVERPRDRPLAEMVRVVPDVVRLVRRLIGDRSVPAGARAALVVLLLWLLSPIDLVPEFIPVLGPLDDVIVTVIVLRHVRRRIGADALRARWPGTAAGFELLSGVIGRAREPT